MLFHPQGLEEVGLNDDDTKHNCGALSIGPLTSATSRLKHNHKMFEKMCSTEKPLYLNFDEALKTSRNIKKFKKKIIIASSYCEDLAKIFFSKELPSLRNLYISSKNLKKFCKKYLLYKKNYSSNYITSLIDKIDPKKQMKILIGSGFAENIEVQNCFWKEELRK